MTDVYSTMPVLDFLELLRATSISCGNHPVVLDKLDELIELSLEDDRAALIKRIERLDSENTELLKANFELEDKVARLLSKLEQIESALE
jgi:predicted RNase H-like nuclease (RuvC/YqgF family)